MDEGEEAVRGGGGRKQLVGAPTGVAPDSTEGTSSRGEEQEGERDNLSPHTIDHTVANQINFKLFFFF